MLLPWKRQSILVFNFTVLCTIVNIYFQQYATLILSTVQIFAENNFKMCATINSTFAFSMHICLQLKYVSVDFTVWPAVANKIFLAPQRYVMSQLNPMKIKNIRCTLLSVIHSVLDFKSITQLAQKQSETHLNMV